MAIKLNGNVPQKDNVTDEGFVKNVDQTSEAPKRKLFQNKKANIALTIIGVFLIVLVAAAAIWVYA